MLTLTNRIDMRPGAVPLVIHLGQYDSDFSLVFELYSSAGNFTVESGTTAMIRGTKTDGNAYDADATIDVSAKTVTVAGSEQMTAAKGRNVYELVLTKSGKVLSTANFILDVERAAMDADTIASESVLKELNAIIAGAETATEAATNAASAADRAEDAAESVSSASAQIATNTADIADLKADLSTLESDVFQGGQEEYPHKTIAELFTDGTYPAGVVYSPVENRQIAIVNAEVFNSYYVTFTESTDIFFDSSLDIGLFLIGKISSVTRTERITDQLVFFGTDPVRYRIASAADIPVESNKLHVNAGDTVIISINVSVSPSSVIIYYGQKHSQGADHTLMNENLKLNNAQIDQTFQWIKDNTSVPGISPTVTTYLLECFKHVAWIDSAGKSWFDRLFEAMSGENPHKTITEFFTDGTYPLGVIYPPASSTQMSIVDADVYKSYYVTLTEPMDIYFDSALNIGTFFIGKISSVSSITKLEDQLVFIGTDPNRYKYTDGEGFPTESDKMHVNAGDTIMISISVSISPDDVAIYY